MKKIVVIENVLYSQISNVLYSYLNLGYNHVSTLFIKKDYDIDEKLYSIFFSCEEVDIIDTNLETTNTLIHDSNIDREVNYAMEKVDLNYILKNIKVGDLLGINNEKDIEIYQMYLGEEDALLTMNLYSIRLGTDDGKYHTYLKRNDREFDYKGVI